MKEKSIRPTYQMELIDKIAEKIWEKYSTYKKVRLYIKKFQEEYWNGDFFNGVSFEIIENDEKIDLDETLHNVDGDTLIKIAIDLEIETPDFIPAFPVFKNIVKENKNLKHIFDVAFQNLEENPSLSIANSNSALESVCKNILKKHSTEYKEGDTLKKLIEKTLKLFFQFPGTTQCNDINAIGSGLIKVSAAIENIRSNKTSLHGKDEDAELVSDPLYAYFIINAVATVGLYIDSFYKKQFISNTDDDLDIDPKDIPF